MNFYVINSTGTTIHVRLDRDNGELFFTVSLKRVVKGRPVTEYVIATAKPVLIGYLSGSHDPTFTMRNPDKLMIDLVEDTDHDAIMRVKGYLN